MNPRVVTASMPTRVPQTPQFVRTVTVAHEDAFFSAMLGESGKCHVDHPAQFRSYASKAEEPNSSHD